MQEEINALKSELIAHRQNCNHKRSMPKGFWPRVKKLSEHLCSEEIAYALGIDLQNLKRRLGQQKTKSKPSPGPFIELPISTEKPHKTVMKISVTDHVVIEVYS